MNVRTSEMVNLNLIQKSLNNSMFSEYISNLALTKILTERKVRKMKAIYFTEPNFVTEIF